MPADLVSLKEAASISGVSVDTIRRLLKKQRLRAWRKLGRRFVSREAVETEIDYIPEEPKK